MAIFTFIANEITDQINSYQKQGGECERVVGNLRGGANPIQGGAWIGLGQRAYLTELLTKVVPQIMELIAAIAGFGGSLGKALGIMEQADKMVSGIVGQVGDIFDQIF